MANTKRPPNLLAASLAGGIMGSAVTAALIMMNDQDNRQRVMKSLDALLNSTGLRDMVDEGRARLDEVAEQARDKVEAIQGDGSVSDDTESRSGDDGGEDGRSAKGRSKKGGSNA